MTRVQYASRSKGSITPDGDEHYLIAKKAERVLYAPPTAARISLAPRRFDYQTIGPSDYATCPLSTVDRSLLTIDCSLGLLAHWQIG